jgi:cytochrome c oxidase subunit 1
MNETWGKVHFALSFVLGNAVFFPMHILGTAGMRRRIPDITATAFEAPLLSLNQFMTICALMLGATQIIFLLNFLLSLFFSKKVTDRNPWHSNTLEWTTTSPAPHGNFETTPIVYRWPYEYGEFPGRAEDNLPQTLKYDGPEPVHGH